MKKLKLFSGNKRCPDKETYKFKKGVALVPGCIFAGQPMKITLTEFRAISKEIELQKQKELQNEHEKS